jgi:hypothetical protein
MDRRHFFACAAAGAIGGAYSSTSRWPASSFGPQPPAWQIIPVVGDGKWIWTEPPKEKGYLEPRQFELSIGVELQGKGDAAEIKATTPVPLEAPEQKIDDVTVETDGCAAEIRKLTTDSSKLFLAAPGIAAGQSIVARARYKLTLLKQYHGYEKDQFPATQKISKDLTRLYLGDSPGIQTKIKEVRELVKEIAGQLTHPWDKARAFYEWVWANIKGRPQIYTSVTAALKDRVGDCEERAAVFVAFCRASGIPARLVWVPNHNWTEMHLVDEQGKGHWIPVHTAAYSWFGWTGVHELVLQKGDNIVIPEHKSKQRLVMDWEQHLGAKPKVRYFAELKPLPMKDTSDPGPGGRSKSATGEWVALRDEAAKGFVRP